MTNSRFGDGKKNSLAQVMYRSFKLRMDEKGGRHV
jgi:hypothetical protein